MSPSPATDRSLTDPLTLGLSAGLVSGLVESLVRGGRYILFGTPLVLDVHLVWMPAVVNGLLFLLIGAGIVLAEALIRRRLPGALLLGGFVALGAFDVLWVFSPRFSAYAAAALALGLGVQVARTAGGRVIQGYRGRLAAVLLLCLLLLVPIGVRLARQSAERSALARVGAPSGVPNILLLVLDTVRSLNLSAYGYYRPTTPVLAQLAERGVRFARPVSTAPWTLPSHASMFTGRWHHELSADWEVPLDGTFPTVAEALTARGYATGGFIANISYCDREWGLSRGFLHYEGVTVRPAQVLRSSTLGRWFADLGPVARRLPPAQNEWVRKPATEVNGDLLSWLDGVGERPFFAFLNYFDAHRRYLPEAPFDTAFGSIAVDSGRGLPFDLKKRRGEMLDYDRSIATIDREIGRLLDELQRRGLLAHTLVIVTADHGEEFEEHGMAGHGNSLYYPSLTVPLVMALPGWTPSGSVVNPPVSLRDLAATILDAAAAPDPRFPGRSLARFWHDSATSADTLLAEVNFARNHPPNVPVSKGDVRAAFGGPAQYIRNGNGRSELYDLERDPWQQRDEAGDSAYRPMMDALGGVIDRIPLRPRPKGSER